VHVRRIQEAEEEWQAKAKDIEGGNMKSMMTILEERGYVNQIVGYGASAVHKEMD
jgi:tyrosyl-tRNA synthetase